MIRPRRTLDELKMEAKLDGGRRFLFCEGPRDIEFFRLHASDLGIGHVHIVSADYLDLPSDVVAPVATVGARGRLIALASIIKPALVGSIVIVVDADLDPLIQDLDGVREDICVTDYSELEMYSATFANLHRELSAALGKAVSQQVVSEALDLSRWLFLARSYLTEKFGCYRAMNIRKCLVAGSFRIDWGRFFGRFAECSSEEENDFCTWSAGLVLSGDPRRYIKFEDAVECLTERLRRQFGNVVSQDGIEHVIRAGLARADFASEGLGRRLRSVLSEASL